MPGVMEELRRAYHRALFDRVLRVNGGVSNNSDRGSSASVRLGKGIIEGIGIEPKAGRLAGQTAGLRFEEATRDFLRDAFGLLSHLRPGEWEFSLGGNIRDYEQYQHLADVSRVIAQHKELQVVFGDYIVTPDIVVGRTPVDDDTVNANDALLDDDDSLAVHTPLRRANSLRVVSTLPCLVSISMLGIWSG